MSETSVMDFLITIQCSDEDGVVDVICAKKWARTEVI